MIATINGVATLKVFTPLHGKNIPQLDQVYDYGSPGSSAHRTFFDVQCLLIFGEEVVRA
jgi:hypothetical protein